MGFKRFDSRGGNRWDSRGLTPEVGFKRFDSLGGNRWDLDS